MSGFARSGSRVILHADDFGMNAAVNQGILNSFRLGLLTSTSLLANAPSAETGCRDWPTLLAEYASSGLGSSETRRELNEPPLPFDLGIHLNLTQGRPLTAERYPAELLDARGNFPGIGAAFYRLNRASSSQLALVEQELRTQIAWMCDRGLRPTHLNGHQYVELIPKVAALIPGILRHYSIPVVRVARETRLARHVLFHGRVTAWGVGLVKRHYATRFRRLMRQNDVAFPDRFFGTCHAGQVTLPTLFNFLAKARHFRCTEVGLHPSDDPSAGTISTSDPWFDPLRQLRNAEQRWLCGAELRDVLINRQLNLGRLQSLRNSL